LDRLGKKGQKLQKPGSSEMSHELSKNGISGRFRPIKIGISDKIMPKFYGISDISIDAGIGRFAGIGIVCQN
jgi:hypothetical protein